MSIIFYGGQSETAPRSGRPARFVVICTIVAYSIALSVHKFANIFRPGRSIRLLRLYRSRPSHDRRPLLERLNQIRARSPPPSGSLPAFLFVTWLQYHTQQIAPATPAAPPIPIPHFPTLYREFRSITFTQYRFLIVPPHVFSASVILMWLVSLFTKKPSPATIARYFK